MPSTKRYFTVLAFGLVLSLCGTLAAANGHDKEDHDNKTLRTTFSGQFWMMNPCPGADPNFFVVDGTNVALFHQDKNHAWAHYRYFAKGSDSVGQPVTAFIHAKAKGDPIKNLNSLTANDPNAPFFEVPFESIWVDNNGAQSWTFSWWVKLYVDKTGIFAANLDMSKPYSIQCTGPVDASTPEHRFNHDNDENDDKN